MKKSSLMGASVVAAALLAAAPIAAPIASLATPGTQIVKADGNTNPASQGAITTLSGAAIGYTVNQSNGSAFSTALTSDNVNKALTSGQSTSSASISPSNVLVATAPVGNTNGSVSIDGSLFKYFFGGRTTLNFGEGDDLSNLKYNVEMSFKGNDGTNSTVSTNNSQSMVSIMKQYGGTLTMHLKFFYADGTSPVSDKDYDVTASIVDNSVTHNGVSFINYKNNLTAHVGDNTNAFLMPSSLTNNGDMVNAAGNGILKDAVDRGAVTMGDVTKTYKAGSTVVADDKVGDIFNSKGTFYQTVTIELSKLGFGSKDLGLALENGLITINGSSSAISTTNPGADAYYHYTPEVRDGAPAKSELILKRTITVIDANSPYTSEKVNGVVTVNMNAGMAAQVYDENGKMVLGRALPNKSAWRTGEKRTYYKNGEAFYQVSTNEFVKARDVTFTADSSSSDSNDELSGNVNVTKYPDKTIYLPNNSHVAGVYAINNDGKGMHQVLGRFLAAGSAWINGAKAEVNGHVFYQVSTNEWVSENSISK